MGVVTSGLMGHISLNCLKNPTPQILDIAVMLLCSVLIKVYEAT